jgi:hypothetical protein
LPAAKKVKHTLVVFLAVIVVIGAYFTISAIFYPAIQITAHDVDRSVQGYNLFAPTVDDLGYSLDEPSEIYLMDMDGEIVHTWQVLGAVQLAKLRSNGNLVYSTADLSFVERAGIREIDLFGNVLWYYKCWADHDFYLMDNGNLLIHFVEDKTVPAIGPGEIRCPQLVEVSPEKNVVWEWRGEDHLDELTDLVGIHFPLEKEGQRLFDWAHNNTCQVMGENETASTDDRFKPGNILFSYCNLNTIGVIDKESGQIVWAWGPGELDGQHNPQMMENGHLLIFDNGTERGYSRIIEFAPLSKRIVWEYSGVRSNDNRFYSAHISGAQLLPNDNVFICQGGYPRTDVTNKFYRLFFTGLLRRNTNSARLFEVDRGGNIVWDCTITLNRKNLHGVYQATRYPYPYLLPLFERLEKVEAEGLRRLKSLPYIR